MWYPQNDDLKAPRGFLKDYGSVREMHVSAGVRTMKVTRRTSRQRPPRGRSWFSPIQETYTGEWRLQSLRRPHHPSRSGQYLHKEEPTTESHVT